MAAGGGPSIEIGLNAAIVAVEAQQPLILVVRSDDPREPDSLPFGPFNPLAHRTFEMGLRAWVAEQTALKIGYLEQLYTFGDRGRHAAPGDTGPHLVSVGYLALTRPSEESTRALAKAGAHWRRWYEYFPWEDWRDGRPDLLDETIMPALRRWARAKPNTTDAARPLARRERLRLAFGEDGAPWDEERVLDRYELLYEAGLVGEAHVDAGTPATVATAGTTMALDDRRIAATALGRLRGKLTYRPVVFELLPDRFTLSALQRTVEALSGVRIHTQNFRRLVERNRLVERTGVTAATGGRPAELFRFRPEVQRERPRPGVGVPYR
jgi:hypothetical protein